MSNFEKKFGKYAIPNLTLVLVMCYAAGYIISLVNGSFLYYLSLDPYAILHGQVWRVFTWVIIPPEGLNLFTLIMLFFYYSIGTTLERTWGTYRYNVYILGGMLITVACSFLCLAGCYLLYGAQLAEMPQQLVSEFFAQNALMFSTYYINMSIFLAFAATFPDHEVLLMFVIPVKVKVLGIIYAVILVVTMLGYVGQYGLFSPLCWYGALAIAASLINFLIFWLRSKNLSHLSPKQMKRRARFKHQVHAGEKQSGHKCSICGRTDADDPNLEFRFCSKCAGSHEYCQYHLFTHEHVK